MKRALLSFVFCLLVVGTVRAEPIRQPPELQPGDKYRLAFVTSTMTTARSSDIETYNAFVQATADASPIGEWGLEWKAIGSTETVSARENTSTDPMTDESVPIYLLDGTELVPSYSILWDAELNRVLRNFDIDEFGLAYNSPDPPLLPVWTGSGPDGLPFILTGQPSGGPLGAGTHSVFGFGDIDSVLWFNGTIGLNHLEAHMYAISEALTTVPEPNSLPKFLILLVALLYVRTYRTT